ncbi:MAG: hypothetical protein A2748_01700 [Candidatus Wildermuthbacteria bacterium RIFCSPHIGHO2_01_FULL_45_20]|uniref:HhH-GPD domain-containing protein n=1 Tax=Candidatus Wildermuthbacteria bacterium RIFCSPHIGHO2_02_FULL_45_25 TaxID=1802450 RepID=A0A1G2R5H4_9BACT|nr:MAG: hypothetical protein A2748_01700 [Candidatus Wildermuthbacteria bacterium RIFCSPHIGHO2_01_FULL_45_20]OHA67818.1 MAG: hypothetical protein A3C04_04225 [Candidatus Wildermuthbacteria bacterium RIFCSPHIGHO2_02_FULL_45_25]
MTIPAFRKTILQWYASHRRNMPWRNTKNPYEILVSEIMLQQTQVSRVLIKYEEFLRAFPTTKVLANASDAELLKVWSGLGYWRRAKYLKETVKTVENAFGGIFPQDIQTLETLPGIGPYTSHALACFAFQNPDAFIDTNIRRVYLHFFFPDQKNISDKEILPIAQKAVWLENPREWHYALFDYGATELKNKGINKQSRHYHKQSKFKGSFRSFRTNAIRYLLKQKQQKGKADVLEAFVETDLRKQEAVFNAEEILASLIKDGLIVKHKNLYQIQSRKE